jgi:putative ATP-dependent endonuclease of OLD family
LQRLAFRDFLGTRGAPEGAEDGEQSRTVLLTTHSPHIVSVAPLKSLVILKRAPRENSTIGASAARLQIDEATVADLERYIDVNRGECVFAKGILLVEGTAEEYLVPALGKLRGVDFDKFGISVCSVNSANFDPYVRLFGPLGLDIPFAVITDRDPQGDGSSLGARRVAKLVRALAPDSMTSRSTEQLLHQAPRFGIFLNEHTLELDLFRGGHHRVMCQTLAELAPSKPVRLRCARWEEVPEELDPGQFLKDLETVGKGRFAQRLASRITKSKCPAYIADAIKYVKGKLS